MTYDVMFPLVKTNNIGHAFVAFGYDSGPEVAFNWGGAGRGGSGSFTGPAKLQRVPWRDARDYFIINDDYYYVFSVINSNIYDAYTYANERFLASETMEGTDDSRDRQVDYNLFVANCVRFSYDVLARAIPWWNLTPGGFTPSHFYSDLDGAATWEMHGVRRTMTIERRSGELLVESWS